MAARSSLWLLLMILFSAVSTSDGAIAYVRPSSNVTCPDQPCLMINDYAKEQDRYFLDGATFMFLTGVHQLDLQLHLVNISDVSFLGLEEGGSAQIFLSPMVNITWIDSNNITITGLEIFLSGQSSFFSALVFGSTTSFVSKLSMFGNDSLQSTAIRTHSSVVELNDVIVSGATSSFGAALVAYNSTINFTGQNYFVNNTATQGGAMSIGQSIVNFHGNISFISNTAAQGGAMAVSKSVANFNGNVWFVKNIAFTSNSYPSALGGAIYCENSVLSFSSSVSFQHNEANAVFGAKAGGILAQSNSVLTFETSSSVTFTENIAMFYGGAISIIGSQLILRGKAIFDRNFANSSGGAISGETNSTISCNSNGERIIFRNNYVGTGLLAQGGAIYTYLSDLELEGVLFEKNMAGSGGAISSSTGNFLQISTCNFYNNKALASGAVAFLGTYTTFNGTNNYQWNLADDSGIVSVSSVNVTFSGENNFSNNNVSSGSGSLTLSMVSSAFIDGNLTFSKNYAFLGGGLYGIQSNVTIFGNALFIGNTAARGGGMLFIMSNLSFTGWASFIQNTASIAGSAVLIRDSSATIGGNMNISDGFRTDSPSDLGTLSFCNSTVSLTGVLILKNNTGDEGGAISATDSEVNFLGCIQCFNNSALSSRGALSSGGALLARNSKIQFRNNSDCNIFQGNIAIERGGAFYAISSTISLSGSLNFFFNSARQGGAIAVDSSSKLVLIRPLRANFIKNNASVAGGAVFHEDTFSAVECAISNPNGIGDCFVELDSTSDIQLTFINNTAGSAGTVLYGGNLDRCRLYVGGGVSDSCGNRIGGNYSFIPIITIEKISNSISVNDMTSNISSDPLQVCFCDNGIPDCLDRVINTVRGQEFTLMALIIGQNEGSVPSSVRTSLDNDIKIDAAQRIQTIGKECTPITYRLSSNKSATSLVLFPDGPCRDIGISRREITIEFLPCPDGFTLYGSECVCEEQLQRYTNSCNVDGNTIERKSNTFWMGAIYENGTFGGLILHSSCPFDYCIDTPVFIELDDLDIQCNHNHSGILCGSCVAGNSITFGTLHCLPCSNVYLVLILPFALAGIALVAMLLLLQISVASGTINGLIFYANVIQVNRSIFFPPGNTNVLTVFIAWLNLDLGIETCFYDGMNTYIFTWLQFLFPIYVWFLIGLIIFISRFSNRIAHALGNNPVAALATLVLLSYSKILRTVIVALSSTILEYPGNTSKVVWLYDGNVPYFQSASHIVLGTFAIAVLLFLFLPYTLLLLCSHWLQAHSHWWIFSWLNKIKPFMDAYHAPYKKESRYWTGFILLVRCALFLTFSFNVLGNTSVNLLAITSVSAGLTALAWMHNRIYENAFNDFLEAAFLLNLCILAAGTYHVKESGGSQAGLAYTLVGIAFVIFICIMLYHVYLRLRPSAVWKKMPKPDPERYNIFNKLVLSHNKEKDADENEAGIKQDDENMQAHVPTTSSVELREPLLEK